MNYLPEPNRVPYDRGRRNFAQRSHSGYDINRNEADPYGH